MNKIYRKSIEDIKVQGEQFADEEMKPIYAEQKKALDSIHALLGTLFITYAIGGLLKMNATEKANSGIKEHLKTMGKDLGDSEVKKVTSILEKVYKDTYYRDAFVMDEGIKIDIKFNILKKEFIDAAVNQKYKGEFFSDRIWTEKADMIDKLQASLIKTMNGETTIDKVAKDIKDTFNTTAYESQRLVNTENARVQSQAIDDIASSTGVTQQMYSATLDSKTASECATLDGTIYDINDPNKVIPPENHPNCRCVLINIPYEGWTPTQRKDNSTKELIDNTTYNDWLKEKGID